MSCRHGLLSLHKAFGQVFLLPGATLSGLRASQSFPKQARCVSDIRVNRPRITRNSGPIDPKSFGPVGYITQVKDEAIPGRFVVIIDEYGKHGRPQNKLDVLNSIDRTKDYLVKIQGNEGDIPICKILPRAKVQQQERASNRVSKKSPKDHKEVEIPWKAADGDIEHKLKVAKAFLQEGKKVDVVLIARRPREVIQDPAQARAIMQRVVERIQKMEGVTLVVDEGSVFGKAVTMHLEDPAARRNAKPKKEEKAAKQIELPWNVTDDDIKRKAFRIGELLAAEIPVELVLMAKKKMYQVSDQDGDQVIERVWAVLSSQVPGIQEVQPREGESGKSITLFLGLDGK